MVKKVYFVIVLFLITINLYTQNYPAVHWGLSLGLFYNSQKFVSDDSTIDSQVDSITLFMINMKIGGLFRVGYYFNELSAIGLESGVIFNSYQVSGPFRCFFKIGPSDFNFKLLGGVSVNREVSHTGDGVSDIVVAGTFEYGGRIEIMHLYFEWIESQSFNDQLLDSSKISFGYSLFLPDLR